MKKKIIISVAVLLVIAAIAGIILVQYRTYDYMKIVKSYDTNSTDNSNYKQCFDGILRYNRDGVALLRETGEVIWNQPCQMNHPTAVICGNSVAVGDQSGTSILVFQKSGLKGEIQTPRPIERLAVSSQGIVGVILGDEESPLVMCYDAVGNELVEYKVSVSSTGYPMDLALSEDGKTLIVSYLNTSDGKICTKISYYYFGDKETDKKDYEVCHREFEDTIVPVVAFTGKDKSLLAADNQLIRYEGSKKPKEKLRLAAKKEIQCMAYSEKLVALLVRNESGADYQLQVYNNRGKLLCEVEVEKEYTHIKISGNQIILYDGQLCSIYTKRGVHKYEGNMDENILEIYPIFGINKYMVINASGFHEVVLAK